MSRSSQWRNRRREERQQQAAERAAKVRTLPCGCRSSLDQTMHELRAGHYHFPPDLPLGTYLVAS